jgi:hypothetical protein
MRAELTLLEEEAVGMEDSISFSHVAARGRTQVRLLGCAGL